MDQRKFFAKIKHILAIQKDAEFRTKVAQMLDISESGAYKKISSITQLTLEETNKICRQLNLKLEFATGDRTTTNHPFVFYCDDLVTPLGTYEQWAANIYNHSLQLNKFKPDYQVWSYQSEISYFHLLPFRHLLYFKLYAWNRSSWQIPIREKFNASEFKKNHALNSLLDNINKHFVEYNSIEIWHVDFINAMLSQIKYFYLLDIFENKEDLVQLIAELKKMILHLKDISESGHKKHYGKNKNEASFGVYLNYTHTSSSLMFIKTPQFKMIYNLFLHPNYIRTLNQNVCEYTEQWINKIISQSELISSSGELARNNFFQLLNEKVENLEIEINLQA